MDEMNRKQMNYQLNESLLHVLSHYVLYDGQVEQYVTDEAALLSERFAQFVDGTLLKRPGASDSGGHKE